MSPKRSSDTFDETEPETPAEVKASDAVVQAKARVAEAEEALKLAQEEHAAAVAAAQPMPDPSKHLVLEDRNGTLSLCDIPPGFDPDRPDRTVRIGGRNYEHVRDVMVDGKAVWVYREM